jgi:hypothetical protein
MKFGPLSPTRANTAAVRHHIIKIMEGGDFPTLRTADRVFVMQQAMRSAFIPSDEMIATHQIMHSGFARWQQELAGAVADFAGTPSVSSPAKTQ